MDVDRVAATHEAAHAVVALRLAFPPAAVSIRPKPGESGRMYHGPATLDIEGTPGELMGLAAVALAGGIGETFARVGRTRLVPLSAYGPTDYANAWTFAELASPDNPDRAFRLALLRARSAVGTAWGAVERVASGLRDKTVLTADEVRHLV